ncbi:MAG TPA: hydroxymethylglutaryl-CoA reductase, degradative [Polyangia bacterium]|nr:hydroxymethylglutaryl-CoA reductase, degradative [Polyangia bacterium]
MSDKPHGSRIPEFRRLSLTDRRRELAARAELSRDDLALLDTGGLAAEDAGRMIENVVGIYALPLGVALNFQINQRDYLVPMAVEEPSVVAAASYAARMVRAGGGFSATADAPVMIAQIELRDVGDPPVARARIEAARAEILALADSCQAVLVSVGGGARDLEVRHVTGSTQNRLVVHLHVNCRDAMGANSVNTMAETVAPRLAELACGRVGLRILSNLADRRVVRVSARVPFAALASDKGGATGSQVAEGVAAASRFAEDDPYRAATHNKGIMNGVDAVVMATGNDWRGVEAGAHAYAARDGRYRPLATWKVEGESLLGRLEMPMAVGTVGGTLQVHPGARLALRILRVSSSEELGMVIGAAGLGQNLAALRALATEGIQRGHMTLHKHAVGDATPARNGPRP